MNKLIKTTALFTFLLLFYGATFGGGWQKYLPNYGFNPDPYEIKGNPDDYLPTKDGGVLIYATNSANNVFHSIIKLDKFGNIQWKKVINKSEFIFNDTLSINKTYNINSGIETVLEIPNDRFVILHNGPTIDTNFTPCCRQSHAYHFSVRYFTVIDKFGNIISRKYDTLDLINNVYNNSTFYFDAIANNYVLFEFTNQNRLSKKNYDTTFNLLAESTTIIDSVGLGYMAYLGKFNSNLFISSYAFGYCNTFKVFDLQGNTKYQINRSRNQSIENSIDDSLISLFPTCIIQTESYERRLSDFYFDDLNHLHLFGERFITLFSSSGDPNCNGFASIFVHVEIDENGSLVKIKTNNLSDLITYGNNAGSSPFASVIPVNNQYCNILINKLHVKIDDYYVLRYSLMDDKIIQTKFIKNGGELKQDVLGNNNFDFQTFLRKKKTINIDNTYFLALGPDESILNSIIKIDSNGNINNHLIQGNVFADQNGNCIKNTTDKNLPQVTVKAVRDINNTAYTSSDNNGNYAIGVGDSGLYTVTAQPNINYPLFAQGNCAVQTSYAYLDSFTIDTINLNLKPTILCPNMYVDISTPMLRRCFSNIYTVNYKNNGTVASPNTYIDVTLDRFLTVNSASIAYSNLGNNVLRFNIGNVDYISSGRFTIDVTVRCDSTIVGQTHCVEAHIFPDTVCAAANYNGPVISASVRCKTDSVEFKLRNSGGNMQNPKRYIVIEDNLNRLNGNYQLNSGQQKIVTIATDSGRTYGIIAEQDDAFPAAIGDKFATAFIEGCNAVNGQFHTGFVTQYPEFDGEPFRSVDCQQNRGSFDPNDKTGYPIGVSAQHYIEKNTAIDYKINFQNTGNDTAFKVVIVDTISKFLDINTIEPGASSHRYTYIRTDSNTIKFIFDSIKLVDSNKNEKLSYGFVKFRIQQKQNNANGTKIYNQAEIYFDYNSPIFTNKTTHTIGDVYVRIISKTINPTFAKADVKIYPNPFRENVTIELQNMELQTTHLILLDILGNEILQLQSNNNKYEINGSALAKGLYLFKIQNDKTEIANGKIMVQ